MPEEPSKGIGRSGPQSSMTGPQIRNNYLLAIGVDQYHHLPCLYNAVSDAKAFVAILQEKYQFEARHTTELYDEQATRRSIYQALDKLVNTITKEDNLIIYFSGHGAYRDQMDEGYWIPVDADRDLFYDFIPNQQIQHYLKRMPSHHSFVVVDSCFSGALFTSRNVGPTERLETVPSRWLLTSGRKELVSDGMPGDHSPFAENILLFLKQNQEPSLPISRLIDDVVHATAANARQTPRGEPLQDTGHKGGQFYFHLKHDEARDWATTQDRGTPEVYRGFLALYPDGRYHQQAKAFLAKDAEEKAWQAALAVNNVQALLDFETQFPKSPRVASNEVDDRINALEEDQLWREATRSNTVSGYREYLRRTRLGKYGKEAHNAMAGFRQIDVEAQRREQENQPAEPPPPKQQPLKASPPPSSTKFSWKPIILPLSGVLFIIIVAFGIWQLVKPSKQATAWDCAALYDKCHKIETAEGIYYMVQEGRLWGYVDEKGEVLVPPRYEGIQPFEPNGWARVVSNGLYGWIDRQGQVKIPFEYETAAAFQDGKSMVKKNGQVFFIDTLGGPAFVAPKMVFVTGGTFTMGCTSEQGSDCDDNEKPAHQVAVSDFQIGKYEVTQAEWKAVMGNNPSSFSGCDQCPVEKVSWNDVQEFIKKLNQKTSGNYRLPTEAEWEYAARGGQKSNKTQFAGSQNLGAVGWYSDNSGSKTHPVGGKALNELGICDMSGNVREWCADHWHENYNGAPSDGSAWVSGGDSPSRVVRGGSCEDYFWDCRVSNRRGSGASSRGGLLGFRLAQD